MLALQAGLPVPAGFVVTTAGFGDFLQAHDLKGRIAQLSVERTRESTAEIRELVRLHPVSADLISEVSKAYTEMGEGAVAIRSSATAEDLPEMSFAGQQDSFLNIRGVGEVVETLRACWASLWSDRAIEYRRQHEIDEDAVAMAVVVQKMVDAQFAGVLFTAHPVTGDRTQMLVNAHTGLGDAVVSGEVNPETHLLTRNDDGILVSSRVDTAAQSTSTGSADDAVLEERHLKALGEIGSAVEALFDQVPQDIEWAFSDDRCWLLQSRAITNLPSAPAQWRVPEGVVLVRRQVVENMPDPLSPLFEDLYLTEGLDVGMETMVTDLGVPVDLATLEAIVPRPFFRTVNGYAYCLGTYRFDLQVLKLVPRILWWSATRLVPMLKDIVGVWKKGLGVYVDTVTGAEQIALAEKTDEQLFETIVDLTYADARYWYSVSMVMGLAKVLDAALNTLVRLMPGDLISGMFLTGIPTQRADAQGDLERIVEEISRRPEILQACSTSSVEVLAEQIESDARLSAFWQTYLDACGHQTHTMDFVEPTLAERPGSTLRTLQTRLTGATDSAEVARRELEQKRLSFTEKVRKSVGPVRRWLFDRLCASAQKYAPHKEDALFHVSYGWPQLRAHARELGERLSRKGLVTAWEDVFYLRASELRDVIAGGEASDLEKRAAARRALRSDRLKLHPPGVLPVGERWKIGLLSMATFETQKSNAADATTLKGFAVSPGRITAPAAVLRSPDDYLTLQPGDILVCTTTTPAWTPLFPEAGGLVTDIGGILAHGSIVAREYGIPAVMGTGNATERIRTGQVITIDGNRGTVELA
jgi:pyruvate,water dikinase